MTMKRTGPTASPQSILLTYLLISLFWMTLLAVVIYICWLTS